MNAMNFALYAQRRLADGLKAVTRLLLGTPADRPAARRTPHVPSQRIPAGNPTPFAIPLRTSPAYPTALKPLRVLCVMEPGQQCASVGRMVISGRMADVCAELDRLAAREAAMS